MLINIPRPIRQCVIRQIHLHVSVWRHNFGLAVSPRSKPCRSISPLPKIMALAKPFRRVYGGPFAAISHAQRRRSSGPAARHYNGHIAMLPQSRVMHLAKPFCRFWRDMSFAPINRTLDCVHVQDPSRVLSSARGFVGNHQPSDAAGRGATPATRREQVQCAISTLSDKESGFRSYSCYKCCTMPILRQAQNAAQDLILLADSARRDAGASRHLGARMKRTANRHHAV